MAPNSTSQPLLLSPAELSYLHTSLSSSPPIRPDGRSATQFRPLIAETSILPGTNGSARICFSDGTEALVGVKAEVEKSEKSYDAQELDDKDEQISSDAGNKGKGKMQGMNEWVEVAVEIPGFRDDDSMPVFLAKMLNEALLADGSLVERLWINSKFHWKLYLDILLLSQPLSYPLPLLSLTTHLALLATRLPKLKSEKDEDPLFDDDWEASNFLYTRPNSKLKASTRPPITLLVIAVKENIICDPSKEELAVAEVALAISISEQPHPNVDAVSGKQRSLKLLAVRTVDPPSRLTQPGVPNKLNTATGGTAVTSGQVDRKTELSEEIGVWQPPRGGAKRKLIASMIAKVLERGGVAEEVLDGLDAVDLE